MVGNNSILSKPCRLTSTQFTIVKSESVFSMTVIKDLMLSLLHNIHLLSVPDEYIATLDSSLDVTEISEIVDSQEDEYEVFDIDCTDSVNMDSLADSEMYYTQYYAEVMTDEFFCKDTGTT